MAFNFGTPAGASAPTFSFGGSSAPAFATASSLPKTASTPLFGAGPASAPAAAPSMFGAPTSAPAFSFAGAASQPSMFGAATPAASAPASTPSFNFQSTFGAATATQQTPSLFGQPQQQQQQQQPLGFPGQMAPGGAATGCPPDDSAIKELQSIKDSYVPGPGNHRYRFQYLFLNVVENPAARVKPADVDELQWREAMRRAGGPDNPDHLWPVQAQGFSGLLARKAAQDEAIKEHTARLKELQKAAATLAARHEAVLQVQLQTIRQRHTELCQQLLRILRHIDALEGRFAHALGFRSSTPRSLMQRLESHLSAAEASLGPGAAGGLQGKVGALIAAARLRAGPAGGRTAADMEASADAGSLASAYGILQEYAEALSRMQDVLRRNARDVAVLEKVGAGTGA